MSQQHDILETGYQHTIAKLLSTRLSQRTPMETDQRATTPGQTLPELLIERHYSQLFGLITFHMTVEDRRPDLSESQAQLLLGYKYKIMINLRLFEKRWSLIWHTAKLGAVVENGKDSAWPITKLVNERPQSVSDEDFSTMLAKFQERAEVSRRFVKAYEKEYAEGKRILDKYFI